MKTTEDIRSGFRGRWTENVLLSDKTWYKIGGPCIAWCEPDDIEDLKYLLRMCKKNDIGFFVHGKGSNLLVSDRGISGIVIDLEKACSFTQFEKTQVTVGAGVYMPKLVLECERQGLAGIEMFAGIPGTVGGAIRMNAGCHGKEMFDVLTEVTTLEDDVLVTRSKSDVRYAYRHVETLEKPDTVIVSGKMVLEYGDKEVLTEKRKAYMEKRRLTQPINLPSSGSVFKNPAGHHAARLIEEAGLKGFRIGGASVSEKHANFIVNEGKAKAADVLEIIKHIRQTIAQRNGIRLETEVKFVGFNHEELDGITD